MPIPAEWNLSGKAAIITADRRGWTPYLAAALAEAGADVAIAGAEDSDMREAADAVEREGRRALAVATDVTDSAQAGAAVERALAEFGKIDILVNNARVEFGKPFADVSEDEWKRVMDFNVGSVFVFCQAVGRHMLEQGRGRIINMNSGLAVRGLWNSTAACASHGAVHQLTSALALEWARSNIRVCGIGAGWVTTDEPDADAQPDLLDRYLPSRRRGHPTDLCGLLVYLASDADDFVTGQTVFIDGGALAHG
jgi:NAD(P)-dependent dehydrogenase (short-subunit alcohol dehydrogenase family)